MARSKWNMFVNYCVILKYVDLLMARDFENTVNIPFSCLFSKHNQYNLRISNFQLSLESAILGRSTRSLAYIFLSIAMVSRIQTRRLKKW